jgi:hypothetical protein
MGGQADAVVAHADDDLLLVAAGAQLDVAAGIGVLGRVGEHVRQHLRQPQRIGQQVHRSGRQSHAEPMLLAIERGPGGFHGGIEHIAQVHRLQPQFEPAAGDARQV